MAEHPPAHAAGPAPAVLPARVTTPLLQLITQQSLDEDYRHVADRRSAGTLPPAPGAARSRLTAAAVALFGVIVAVAAVQTARNADVASAGREQLIARIDQRRDTLASIQDQLARLRDGNTRSEAAARAVGSQLDSALATEGTLARQTGFAAMSGTGVRFVVDDAPGGDLDGEVRDQDLALLVNGLWEGGAVGIAVNGQRVTVMSALRNSGQVIRINGRSLSPPYTVEAIGDDRTLQAGFAESTSGAQFQDLVQQLGMPFSMENVSSLRVPAAPERIITISRVRPGTSKQPKPPVNQEETK